MFEQAVRHLVEHQPHVLIADFLGHGVERHGREAGVQRPHHPRQYGAVADTRVEYPKRRRGRLQIAELEGNPVCDLGLLAAGRDEQEIFLPVVEKPEAGGRCVGRGGGAVDRLCGRRRPAWRGRRRATILRQIGADLVEGAGGDLCAVAQARHQLAIVDDAAPERGFGCARRAAIIPDFAENLIGGCAGLTLTFLDPHGDLARLSALAAIKGRPSSYVNHNRSGQQAWARAHRSLSVPPAAHRARREKNEISTGSVTRITTGASIMPVTTTTASGFCTCEPMPSDSAAGSRPTPATTQVISTGRSCNSPVRITALMRSMPSSMSWLNCERMIMPSITAMPNSAMKPI